MTEYVTVNELVSGTKIKFNGPTSREVDADLPLEVAVLDVDGKNKIVGQIGETIQELAYAGDVLRREGNQYFLQERKMPMNIVVHYQNGNHTFERYQEMLDQI